MLAAKATVKAEKAAVTEKMAAKKLKRAELVAADKRAMKAAECDPHRMMPGLTRPQLYGLKIELSQEGFRFPPYTPPLSESAAAIAELAKIAAEKKSEAAAKRARSKKRRQGNDEAHVRDVLAAFNAREERRNAGCGAQQPSPVKREVVSEESMGPPLPPPPLPEPSKSKKRRTAACGAQQPLPVKREPVVEESMGPPPPPPPLPVHISNDEEVRCCGFVWIASVASRL